MLQTTEPIISARDVAAVPPRPRVVDDLAVRRALRGQIARLESRLGALCGELGRPGRSEGLPPSLSPRSAGPRLVGVAELERARDQLVARVSDAERRLADRETAEAAGRARLEAMLADPAGHRWEIVPREQLGLPACGAYHVRPRLGLLGMLFGWWCVKLSSGCP